MNFKLFTTRMGHWGIVCFILTSLIYVQMGSALNLTVTPKSAEAKVGSDVVLNCVFSENAVGHCNWHLNISIINIAQPYSYIGDLSAGDCSLKISPVSLTDAGPWRCSYSGKPTIYSPPAYLTVTEGLSSAAIAGIVIGCIVFVLIVGGVVFYLVKKHRKPKVKSASAKYTKGEPVPKSSTRVEIE